MTDKNEEEKRRLATQLQIGLQQALEMQTKLAELTSRCYQRCTDKPGRSLTKSQQECIWHCAQRWTEIQHFIAMRSADLVRQRMGGGGGTGVDGGALGGFGGDFGDEFVNPAENSGLM